MKKILVAVDFSKNTETIVTQAAALAGAPEDKLWILHATRAPQTTPSVYEYTAFSSFEHEMTGTPATEIELARDLCADEYKREHQLLLSLSAKLKGQGIHARAMLLQGDAADLIIKKAAELAIDIIVMGSHGHSPLHKVLIGSVTEAVLHKARCKVLLVPAPPESDAEKKPVL